MNSVNRNVSFAKGMSMLLEYYLENIETHLDYIIMKLIIDLIYRYPCIQK